MRTPQLPRRSATRRPFGATGRAQAPVRGPVDGAAPTNWLRSIRFSGFTVLMLAVLILFVVIVAPGARIFIEQRQQIADLQNNVSAAEQKSADLTADIARWNDPAYIRAQARERLFYVLPGETSFLVLDDTAGQGSSQAAPVSTSIQTTKTNWMSALFASAMTAGLSTQTPDQLQKAGITAP